ncbi:unnamed protein product [Somion occarium]|uniref:RNA polymerase II-associated protein 1 C-terminal domain-containing protein n=1 Tax=Somion occarium TaxID=3059160 RepID=A0ABP1E3B0_9APHY
MTHSNGSTPLIGSVFERKPGLSTSSSFQSKSIDSKKTGFPSVKHRSQSAFSRARVIEKTNGQERPRQPPTVTSLSPRPSPSETSTDDWRRQVEEENLRKVESMTAEEREEERREILERFGSGIEGILKKARVVRESREVKEDNQIEVKPEPLRVHTPRPLKAPRKGVLISRPSSPLSASSTRPPSRDKHLRFADISPQDVHVYESAPPSPKRKPLALAAPTANDGPTISLGDFQDHFKLPSMQPATLSAETAQQTEFQRTAADFAAEEGTPEDIRRRFFPTAAANVPSLAWITGPDSTISQAGPSIPSLRFDLTGTPIPSALSSTLPTHLGLHHHAEGTHAGYTLDDLFLLSRSTVPAQRASMLDVLNRIAQKLADGHKDSSKGIPELAGQEKELRKRILAAGVEAMGERGSLGAQAIAAMWTCLVGWDEDLISIEGVELKEASDDDAISSLPLEYVLPQIATAIRAVALPMESLTQLLAIVHRLVQHSNEIAVKIVETPTLVASIVQTFLLTPIPPPDESSYPDPFAIQVLITLALASRSNASMLTGPADALLRFVVTLPNSSSYPLSLATTLLSSTLRLYTTLASYGFYAQIATTAYEHFDKLGRYVRSEECRSLQLRAAWLGLVEAWTICARDPHRTTPTHEILWSQIVGWGWNEDVLSLRQRLTPENGSVWAAIWRAEAAWLEGASVNGVKNGESEKSALINGEASRLLEEWTNVKDLVRLRGISKHANVVASAIRLWLSCLPSASQTGLESPPFRLPFKDISALCAVVATHSIWEAAFGRGAPPFSHLFCRPLSGLLSVYLDLSRVMPGTSDDLWMAQAFTIVLRLLPGDEDSAIRIIEGAVGNIHRSFMESRNWHVPPAIWEKNGMDPIMPFLTYSLRVKDVVVGPYWMSPKSISTATTQRLPPQSSINPDTRKELSLPLNKDWAFVPLDYLLRSGQTDIFKTLPSAWNYSETEVVRATLLLVRVEREVLKLHGLQTPILSREETVFGCMKVFMLEHEQQQESIQEEVFRDSIVGSFMEDTMAPFTIAASSSTPSSSDSRPTLEVVAKRFLGDSIPFYQYYTDFVGLYDSVSFSHPLFARLLLPPTSMRYAVDYRKYLWADYSHIVKTIKTPIEAVIADSVDEYLYPVETSAEVIGAYLRTLVKGGLEGFVRLVAVHHIACNIWPDLRNGVGDDGKAAKLLQAVVTQCGFDAVREVVLYRQTAGSAAVLPPACFEQAGEWKVSRREFLGHSGDLVKERIEKLL